MIKQLKYLRTIVTTLILMLTLTPLVLASPNASAADPGTLITSFTPPVGPFTEGQTLTFHATLSPQVNGCRYDLAGDEMLGGNDITIANNQFTVSYTYNSAGSL
jgi:hypothetical protein